MDSTTAVILLRDAPEIREIEKEMMAAKMEVKQQIKNIRRNYSEVMDKKFSALKAALADRNLLPPDYTDEDYRLGIEFGAVLIEPLGEDDGDPVSDLLDDIANGES